jgi:hypothetical protein
MIHVCQPRALVMTDRNIAVVDATRCLVWWPCVSRGRGRVWCNPRIYAQKCERERFVLVWRNRKYYIPRTVSWYVIFFVNCMFSHNNVYWAADHKKHNSRCCCKINVSSVPRVHSVKGVLKTVLWKLCSTQWYKVAPCLCVLHISSVPDIYTVCDKCLGGALETFS